jgi:hypothetical protein
MAKAAVQGMVDARALHLCQQWNFVVNQARASTRSGIQGFQLSTC